MACPIRSSSDSTFADWMPPSDTRRRVASQKVEQHNALQHPCFEDLNECLRELIQDYYTRAEEAALIYEKLDSILRDYEERSSKQPEGLSSVDYEKLADRLISLITLDIPHCKELVPPDTSGHRLSEMLHMASEAGFWGLLKPLLDRGANVNELNENGETAFFVMIEKSNENSIGYIKLCLQRGGDPNIEDYEGNSAFSIIDDRIKEAETKEEKRYLKEIKALLLSALTAEKPLGRGMLEDPIAQYQKQKLLDSYQPRRNSI